MNQNIVILIVALVAVNLILITIAVVRSMRRKDTYRRDAAIRRGRHAPPDRVRRLVAHRAAPGSVRRPAGRIR
jgi:hypothetical protein